MEHLRKIILLPRQYVVYPSMTEGGKGGAKTYSLLGQLPRTLVLAVAQQFDHPSLVRGEAGDFFDDLAHEGGAFGEVAFGSRDARFAVEGRGGLDGPGGSNVSIWISGR